MSKDLTEYLAACAKAWGDGRRNKGVEGDPVSVLEKVRLTLPVKVIERPVYVEFRDLPLE